MAEKALVGIIMGSKSDLPVMGACTEQLEEFGVPFEMIIAFKTAKNTMYFAIKM